MNTVKAKNKKLMKEAIAAVEAEEERKERIEDKGYRGHLLKENEKSKYSPELQFLYKPFLPLPDLTEYNQKIIEVRVFRPYLTKFNRAVQ